MTNISPEIKSVVREIAHDATRQAVEQTLIAHGIDAEKPFELQKDMGHLREWRLRVERLQDKSLSTVVVIIIGVIAAAIGLGIKSKLGL